MNPTSDLSHQVVIRRLPPSLLEQLEQQLPTACTTTSEFFTADVCQVKASPALGGQAGTHGGRG